MPIKRSVSPDGRIASVSVAFSMAVSEIPIKVSAPAVCAAQEEGALLPRERNCWRKDAPFFLYASDPAFRNASQTCATLRPSVAAIASS